MKHIPRLVAISLVVVASLFIGSTIATRTTSAHEGEFDYSVVATGLDAPTAMAFSPDGRLFVSEKGGRLRVIQNDSLLPTPFMTLAVDRNWERGLLGIAFDPNFTTNRYVYVYYTRTTTPIKNRVSRFTASATNPNVVQAGSEVVIIDDIPSDAGNHNGGAINFGPDGKLYIAIGDGGETSANAQSLSILSGKILRINSDGTIPSDNPFVNIPGARGEIYAYGLRNPFTFSFNPVNGRMYINDVGQSAWEEIDLGVSGANYGWPTCEGPQGTGVGSCNNPAFTYPISAYKHPFGYAITGGTFYYGSTFPAEYYGDYFFGDYVGNWITTMDANYATSTFATTTPSPVDLRVGPDGSLYYLSYGDGKVGKISFDNTHPPVASFTATPPGSLTAPVTITFDASASQDHEGTPLDFVWDFGDGSATTTGTTTSHTFMAEGSYDVTLVAANALGESGHTTQTMTIGSAPVGTITAPADGHLYSAGDTITYSGSATDVEDGTLPASAYKWEIVFHHDTHTHPFEGPFTGITGGSFTIPTIGEIADNVWYRVHLTVTDSSGLRTSSYVDVVPRKSIISLQSTPSGLTLSLDGQPTTTPTGTKSVVNMTRTLSAPASQVLNGIVYNFSSWSDGGAATHTISTPATNTTYTATYIAASEAAHPKENYLSFNNTDGTGDYAFIPNTSNFAEGGPLTVSFWARTPTPGVSMTFIAKAKSGFDQWVIRKVGSNNKVTFNVREQTSNALIASDSPSNQGNDGLWHHYAGVYDPTAGTIKLFIDGSSASSTTGLIDEPMREDDEAVCIGAMSNSSIACNGSNTLRGDMDDVRIYNRALTSSEITASMNTELTGNEPGLIGYWRFNDAAGQAVTDLIGLHNGTLGATSAVETSDPTWISTTGPAPDTSAPSISITTPAGSSTATSTITITAIATDNVGVTGVQFLIDGTNLGAQDTAAPYSTTWNTTTVLDGLHTIAAVAKDAAGNAATSSVTVTVANADTQAPAISQVTATSTGTSTATVTWTTSEAANGKVQYGPTTSYGSMTALNPSLTLPHTFSLNGLASSTLYHYRVISSDAAGNTSTSSDATFTTQTEIVTPPGTTTPPTGSSTPKTNFMSFNNTDGTGDYIYLPNTSDFAETGPMTIAFWARSSVIGQTQTFIAKAKSGFDQWVIRKISSNNKVSFSVREQTSGTTIASDSPSNQGNDGLWHHYAGVYDPTAGTVKLFVDGSGANTTTGIIDEPMRNDDEAVCIGAMSASAVGCLGSGNNLRGDMDDLRIYNRALTATEIQSIMNTEGTGTETGLIGYWKLNEGSGQSVSDVLGSHNGIMGATTATETTDPTWVVTP